MACRTAARLAWLTWGESFSTSETSDRDTPARRATVSSVGRPVSRLVSGVATGPPVCWSVPTLGRCEDAVNDGTMLRAGRDGDQHRRKHDERTGPAGPGPARHA